MNKFAECSSQSSHTGNIYKGHENGHLEKIWGFGVYPVLYEYNGYGRMTKMNTYRGGSGWSSSTWPTSPGTADTTEWIYHEASGLLIAKKDAAGKQVSYTYTAGGKLATRTWSRTVGGIGDPALVTVYSYSSAGDLTGIDYSDSTPDVSFTYDRLGRQKTAASSASAHTFAYSGLLFDTETIVSSAGTNVIDRSYDFLGRPAGLVLQSLGDGGFGLGSDYQVAYGYDALGRFNQISNFHQVSYSYLPNSDLLSGYIIPVSNFQFQVSKTYEQNRNLLTQVKNEANGSTLSQFDYANDAGGRRVLVQQSGTGFQPVGPMFTHYGYNSRSELTTADRYFGTNPNNLDDPVPGQSFAYGYDPIGNRQYTMRDNEESIYTANNLNQYLQRTVPGKAHVSGSAKPEATVTINDLPVDRHDAYWHKALEVKNATKAAYPEIEVVGVYNPETEGEKDIVSEEKGCIFVPRTPEKFKYDADGNMIQDGRFNYTWDGENRLIAPETRDDLPAKVPRIRGEYKYDHQGRRVEKKVFGPDKGKWERVTENRFVYDNWNLIKETETWYRCKHKKNGQCKCKGKKPGEITTTYYVWGHDLSGSLQGAGGVGGLLCVIRNGTRYFPQYDANGNISDYVGTNGVIVAHREYDAFGNTVVATGPMVNDFHFWFSTKYLDHETGLYYYGYRWYSPSLGRFLSRDPIGEEGGRNLYAFTKNNPVNQVDPYGLLSISGIMETIQGYLSLCRSLPRTDLISPVNECPAVEGAYRHCWNYCVGSRCALLNATLIQLGLIFGELAEIPPHPDTPSDLWSNLMGVINAFKLDTCSSSCTATAQAAVDRSCCPSHPGWNKDHPNCCK